MRRVVAIGVATLLVACGSPSPTTTSPGATSGATAPGSSLSPTTTTSALPVDPPGRFTGADGVTSDVSDPTRIVSLTGDITEVIYELGFGAHIVAVDITTTYPEETDALKSAGGIVGFGQALNVEAVLKFEPTLVIGDETVGPQETIGLLRDAGIPVVIMTYHDSLDGVAQKIRDIAHILGVPADGDALAERVEGEIDAARSKARWDDSPPRVAFLYTRGPSLIFLFGEGIPTNGMIEGAGAIDVGAEIGEGSMALTPEALVAAAPDVIVVPESGLIETRGMESLLEIQGVGETPAGLNGAFLAYDEAYFFNLGPRAGLALAEFVDDLHELLGD